MPENWTLHFDGACEPVNPRGIATYGFVIKKGGVKVKDGKGLAAEPGSRGSTCNVAEYTGLLRGLEAAAVEVPPGDSMEVIGDSQLAIRQMTGEYQVRAETIIPLFAKVKAVVAGIEKGGKKVTFRWVRRDLNGEADKLSKDAIQEALKADPEIPKKLKAAALEPKEKPLAGQESNQGRLF